MRDIAMAISFGSSPEIAAFMVAYRLANLFRRLLGESNLQAGFVPHYVEIKEEGPSFFRDVAYSMGLILVFAVVLLESLLWGAKFLVGPDWTEILNLSMWMAPGLFFICLYGLNSALLQCQKRYFLPAVAPVAFNFVWIGAVFIRPDVTFLAVAITFAFAGQWILTFVSSAKVLSFSDWLKPKLFSKDFRALLKPLILGIVGVSAVQLNSALDAIFARLADPEGPAFLWYAIRIQQLPLALFGIALSGALLPPLSRTQDPLRRQELLQSALKQSAILMLICTFGIFSLGFAGVNLLYGHGSFSPENVRETANCLSAYGIGLVPSVFVLLLAARFYAEKNYRLPTVASLLSVLANIALNALFVFCFDMGAISIAVATSLSAFLNMAVLSRGSFPLSSCIFLMKMTLCCAMAAAFTLGVAYWGMESFPRSFIHQAMQVGTLSLTYLMGVGICCWALGLQFWKKQVEVG